MFSLGTFLHPHQADAQLIGDVNSSVVKIVAPVNGKTKVGCEFPPEQHLFEHVAKQLFCQVPQHHTLASLKDGILPQKHSSHFSPKDGNLMASKT